MEKSGWQRIDYKNVYIRCDWQNPKTIDLPSCVMMVKKKDILTRETLTLVTRLSAHVTKDRNFMGSLRNGYKPIGTVKVDKVNEDISSALEQRDNGELLFAYNVDKTDKYGNSGSYVFLMYSVEESVLESSSSEDKKNEDEKNINT